MSIFKEISSQIALLLASPGIEVKFHKLSLALESEIDDLLETLSSVFEIKCPPSIAASVEIDDQLNAYWKGDADSGTDAVFGEFFLRSVLLFGSENDLNPVFQSKQFDGLELRDTRVFDYCPYNGGPIYALFPVIDDVIDDRVLIFNEREVSRTSLNYISYLQLVRLTRGFLFWQYLFCERINMEDYEIAAIQRGLAFIEREFPRENYSDLRRRLQAVESRR